MFDEIAAHEGLKTELPRPISIFFFFFFFFFTKLLTVSF